MSITRSFIACLDATPEEPEGVVTLSGSIALLSDGATEPPRELRLFAAGEIDTTKGRFLFDEQSAVSVMAAHAELGRDYPFDYCHAMLSANKAEDPAESGKAAGWFKPEIRNGECWATGIEWTPKAREKILSREFRYISPTFLHDRSSSRRVVALHSCALTNDPATKGIKPITTSRDHPASEDGIMLKLLIAALGLAESATETDVQAAIKTRLEAARLAGEQLAALVALAGKKTADEAQAVFTAWKAAAEQVTALTAKIAELESKAKGAALEQLIAKGKADGKIPPTLEPWAKTQTVEALTAYLEVAPKIAPSAAVTEKPREPGAAATGTAAEIAAQCGVSPEALAQFRENPNPTAPAPAKK